MLQGHPVLTVRSLVTRPMTAEQLNAAVTTAAARRDCEPLEVVWSPIPPKPDAIDGSGEAPGGVLGGLLRCRR